MTALDPSALDADRTRAQYLEQSDLLADLTAAADPSTPVPTCPEWTLRQLVTHVGRGERWAATIVADRAEDYVDIRSVPDGKPPADADAAAQWLRDGARLLVDAVATDPDTPVWTFTGPQPAAWWVRRRLHETAVHRADAALALGAPYELAADLAADGISEWLMLLTFRPAAAGPPPLAAGATLHLHATDEGLGAAGEWLVRGGDAGVEWEHGHGKASAAVRGSAADLLLAAFRRIPADDPRIQVLGDAGVWDTWLERTSF